MTAPEASWPRIRPAGIDGVLISFADRLSEPANRAALALRAAIDGADWAGVEETSTSLVSTYLRFDPLHLSHADLLPQLRELVAGTDWMAAPLPSGRRFFRVPTVYGTDLAPQLDEAAAEAGMSPGEAIDSISGSRVRVQTIGFAPGQPYLGELPPAWDIPRQTDLTPRVSPGALVVAIRQLVLFSVSAPTGWRQIGQTAFRPFRPERDDPFALRPGDEVQFIPVTREEYERISRDDPDGGVAREVIG